MSEERMKILQMISEGTISAEQGAQLIQALEDSGDESEADEVFSDDLEPVEYFEPYEALEPVREIAEDEAPEEAERAGDSGSGAFAGETAAPEAAEVPEPPMDFNKWRSFWYIPLAIGVLITAVSGLLVYAGNQGSWNWFWMSCVWFPLLLGIGVILLSWMSRTARWLHVRVNTGQDEWPRRIAISLPLPLRASAWGMRIFGRFIPGLDNLPLPIDEAIIALETSLSPDDPLYVHVEDTGGERVEVFIG